MVEIKAAQLITQVRELKKHRGIAYLGEHEIMQMLNHASDDYVLISVHQDWERMAIACVVAHPDLPETVPGVQLPVVDPPHWQREISFHDGEIWQRATLSFAAPRNPLHGVVDDEPFEDAYRREPVVRELCAVVSMLGRRLREHGEDTIPI